MRSLLRIFLCVFGIIFVAFAVYIFYGANQGFGDGGLGDVFSFLLLILGVMVSIPGIIFLLFVSFDRSSGTESEESSPISKNKKILNFVLISAILIFTLPIVWLGLTVLRWFL